MGLDLTWISQRGVVYQVTGLSPIERFNAYRDIFLKTAGSFRPLSEAERSGITEVRLRILRARQGETLEDLIKRGGGVWTPAETAVSNGLREGVRLREGQLIKVAVQQSYRGARKQQFKR